MRAQETPVRPPKLPSKGDREEQSTWSPEHLREDRDHRSLGHREDRPKRHAVIFAEERTSHGTKPEPRPRVQSAPGSVPEADADMRVGHETDEKQGSRTEEKLGSRTPHTPKLLHRNKVIFGDDGDLEEALQAIG